MRIWSLHPRYLDTKGLVAVWREALLAKKILEGKTKGYRQHPQLNRFRLMNRPLDAINHYLSEIHKEAASRNFHFDVRKIDRGFQAVKMTVTRGQLAYERVHLLKKLAIRDPALYARWCPIREMEPVPPFRTVDGAVEDWEIQTVQK